MMRRRGMPLILITVLLLGLVPLLTAAVLPDHAGAKVLVQTRDSATLDRLKVTGGTQLADYGAFSLWRMPTVQRAALADRSSVTFADDFDTVYLRNGAIDTTTTITPPVSAKLRQAKISGAQFWIVQFVGPVKPEWLDGLKRDGLEVVQYLPNNSYVVWGDGTAVDGLTRSVQTDPVRQWAGEYHPAYRLAPELTGEGKMLGLLPNPVAVNVQFYNNPGVSASIAAVTALGSGKLIREQEQVGPFINLTLSVPVAELVNIANRADVFNVERFTPLVKNDEAQGQILAGNLTTSAGNVVPSGPGYLAWLDSKGFPHDPAQYPIVTVIDDGVDNGTTTPLHPDFYVNGDTGSPSRLVAVANCTADALPDNQTGHGSLSAGIVGAYNNRTGTPYQDANGYRIGLGVSPYGRIGNEKIFNNAGNYDISACGTSNAGVVTAAYAQSAAITSNSLGAPTAGAYDSVSQAYDALTRDASAATAGSQQMLHVFSSGDSGSGSQTVGSPGTAKNVLTVGATEGVRDNGVTDGCQISAAANADNAASFSSRGPTADGRAKPDITAPGTHIQGPASQDATFDGTAVCGGPAGAKYYPAGQTLYTWSRGTSIAAPAVAGAASLLYNYYGRVLAPGQTPSPAMLKALLLNTPRYLNGVGTGDTLPSPAQGWGDVNLGALFDGTPRLLTDQSQVFTTTGQKFSRYGSVYDRTRPTRITLVWTDAPGATTGAAYTNNLDLTVSVGGQTYKGNVFSGANSVTGGTADAKNNVENVFLPAGFNGPFAVTVTAANIAAKADPNGTGTVNQDFALVITNATDAPAGGTPVVTTGIPTFSDSVDSSVGSAGNGNGIIEPNETIALNVPLQNVGNAAANGISVTLTSTTPTVSVIEGRRSYPALPTGGAPTNATSPFIFNVSATQPCSTQIAFTETVSYASGLSSVSTFTLPFGGQPTVGGTKTTYTSTNVPKAIPDNTPAGVTSTLPVMAPSTTVGKVTVHVAITHTYDSDLIITLISPNNTAVILSNRHGGGGDNYTGTIFDDDAATAISTGTAPFTGSYRPDQPLSVLKGSAANGTWSLKVSDNFTLDTGNLTGWSIDVQPLVPAPCPVYTTPITLTGIQPANGPVTGGNTVTLIGSGFTASMVVSFGATSGTVTAVTMGGTRATVTVPAASTAGAVDVTVSLPAVTPATLPQGYEYQPATPAPGPTMPAPYLATSSVSPATAPPSHPLAPTVIATPNMAPVRH